MGVHQPDLPPGEIEQFFISINHLQLVPEEKNAHLGGDLPVLLKVEQGINCQLPLNLILELKAGVGLVINDMHFVSQIMDCIDKPADRIVVGREMLFPGRRQLHESFREGDIIFSDDSFEIFDEMIGPVKQHQHGLLKIKFHLVMVKF